MIREQLNVFHMSGKWDASQDQFEQALLRMRLKGAHVITLTEMGDNAKVRSLRVSTGWGTVAFRDNMLGECAQHYNKTVLKYVKHKVHTLTTLRVKTDTGFLRPPVTLLKVVYRHRGTGRKVIVCTVHMVSGVERDVFRALKWRPTLDHRLETPVSFDWRPTVWLDGLRGLKRRMRRIIFWHPNAVVILTGDFNVNLENDDARILIERATGMRLAGNWENVKGTFKDTGRRIDALFVAGPDVSVGQVEHGRFPGFDHHWLHFPVFIVKR